MKKILPVLLLIVQTVASQSVYNAKETFHPQFYPYPGNTYRSAGGQPGHAYWQNQSDYQIQCTLDETNHSVKGDLTLTYTNNSPDALGFIWMQLDQNIYKPGSRGSATTTQIGGRWANSEYTDGYNIQEVEVESAGNKYTPTLTVTDTRMQIKLQESIPANGGKITVRLGFSFTIPSYGTDRLGRLDTKNGIIYEVAQWFPRTCVYDDIQGWNTLPYTGAGEFYLEYGNIDFTITAPRDMIVVASGALLNPEECFSADELNNYNDAKESDKTVVIRSEKDLKRNKNTGTTTWKFSIQNTRDVAWAASRAFILDGARIHLPSGKKSLALSAYPVESTEGKKEADWKRSTEMIKGSIEHYSEKWYEYPYAAAVNVAGTVGGMEYPGIVFCSYAATGSSLWGVTDHEFGHTWFPMIVGSNERKYAWMDEGFNTFINGLSTKAFKKGAYAEENFLSNPNSPFMVKVMFDEKSDGLYTVPDAVQPDNLGFTAYFKPAQMLNALRDEVLGPDRFDAAFKEYIYRWAFKHPTPWDFFRTMENVSGEDLSWFWRGWVLNTWKLDQSVKSVSYADNDPKEGANITIENLEKMAMPVTLLINETNGKQHRIRLPVEVWQRGAVWTFGVPTTSEIKELVLDPDHHLPDFNRDNNTWKKGF